MAHATLQKSHEWSLTSIRHGVLLSGFALQADVSGRVRSAFSAQTVEAGVGAKLFAGAQLGEGTPRREHEKIR
jgi:hypothetical protein